MVIVLAKLYFKTCLLASEARSEWSLLPMMEFHFPDVGNIHPIKRYLFL